MFYSANIRSIVFITIFARSSFNLHRDEGVLDRIITCVEKWILYDKQLLNPGYNIAQKRLLPIGIGSNYLVVTASLDLVQPSQLATALKKCGR